MAATKGNGHNGGRLIPGPIGGPQNLNSPTRPRRVKATTETMVQAAQLRSAGATFREIGEALGIDGTWARQLVIRALEAAEYEAADLMRTQEGIRLDRLQRANWPAALGGDTQAGRLVLKIMERRARLFGLDAPAKVEVSGAAFDFAELDRELTAILDAAGGLPDQ